jgi:hypothetical protein
VVEVQMRQHDAVDVLIREARLVQIVEQDVPLLLYAEPVAELRRKERANARLEQDAPVAVFDKQGPACERNAVELVGLDPFAPERARRIAEHRASIEAL